MHFQVASMARSAALRIKCLSFVKTCSIDRGLGFKAGEQSCSGSTDGTTGRLAFVARLSRMTPYRPKSWNEKRLDVRREAELRTVEDAGRIDAIAARARKVMVFQCPYGTRRKPPPAQSPAPDRRHVRPGLVDEDEARAVPDIFSIASGCIRKRAMSGRSRLAARFFEAQRRGRRSRR